MTMRALYLVALSAALSCGVVAHAAEIGVTPVVVNLDKANDRATVTVNNSGVEPVIMQVEAIAWRRSNGVDEDAPTSDMVINPSVFTIQPGQAQLVRVGLRRAAQSQSEGTYRIVLREVPAALRPGEIRVSGQVQVLMALRVPIYVAPANVVRELRWQATQAADGSVTASLRNEGNVHVRVANIQLRSVEGVPVSPAQSTAAVVFPGEGQSFRLRGVPSTDARPMMLDVATDQGVQSVPVVLARR